MKKTFFEIQGFTWKARAPHQQDAILIDNKVIQHNGLITKRCVYDTEQEWCAAIADGVSQSPKAAQASKKILQLTSTAFKNSIPINFEYIQNQFSLAFSSDHQSMGASTTLALIHHTQSNFLSIKHLGNSRAYLYSLAQKFPRWFCLTRDHTHLEELREKGELKSGQNYASIYNILTEFFCADSSHLVNDQNYLEEYLTENEAIVLCSDGVHDILECHEWPLLNPTISIKDWLKQIKIKLEHCKAYDNVSIIVVRLKKTEQLNPTLSNNELGNYSS